MNSFSIVGIDQKELIWMKEQIINIQQQNLSLMKQVQQLLPAPTQSSVPDFISIKDACEKYHISHQTIHKKLKMFKDAKGREIDRMQSGAYSLINEVELQEAIRIKGSYRESY